MFILSKLFWLIAQPLSLSFLLNLIGLIAFSMRFRLIGFVSASFSLIILSLTLYTSAGTMALQALEVRFPRATQEPQHVSCLIVLGGAFDNPINTVRGGYEMNQAADRFVEALRLAQHYPDSKILVAGGDGSLNGQFEGDAVTAERYFKAFDIDSHRLIQETASRNTAENVENTKTLLQQADLKNCLLITSAFHMPRAMGLMRKNGLVATPWPTDYRTDGISTLGLDFTQPTLNAQESATALREWIGLAAYYFAGKTSAFFPAP